MQAGQLPRLPSGCLAIHVRPPMRLPHGSANRPTLPLLLTCATQPTVRAMANSTVYISTGMPSARSTMPE